MSLKDMIETKLLYVQQQEDSVETIFKTICKKAQQLGYTKASYFNALQTRELSYPTGLALPHCGIAIPHTDFNHVKQPFISVMTLRKPVFFHAMDGVNGVAVQIVFVLGLTTTTAQLASLKAVMAICRSETRVEQLLHATDASELFAILTKEEAEL
ncbi:PTS sugar transporter subunit IIA [Brochothrix campestris]|uniref:PTS transporter subunit IIA-like nitrogen-regulatory protein PtsN n=1 Tax=Brochothrix campestris FSL F6-1037 TaxID=1265861 RepID=W7CJ07_9LIST|nr:PTS sugar transporter subunit IIA [Brochothrix campestris]EUJ39339.1 PTS transporter subunit IIA-like nitrogen-regulatory protein PtsN [Brochothrix campestris FSL F6-1037]